MCMFSSTAAQAAAQALRSSACACLLSHLRSHLGGCSLNIQVQHWALGFVSTLNPRSWTDPGCWPLSCQLQGLQGEGHCLGKVSSNIVLCVGRLDGSPPGEDLAGVESHMGGSFIHVQGPAWNPPIGPHSTTRLAGKDVISHLVLSTNMAGRLADQGHASHLGGVTQAASFIGSTWGPVRTSDSLQIQVLGACTLAVAVAVAVTGLKQRSQGVQLSAPAHAS